VAHHVNSYLKVLQAYVKVLFADGEGLIWLGASRSYSALVVGDDISSRCVLWSLSGIRQNQGPTDR